MLDQLNAARAVVLKGSMFAASATFVVDGEIADPGAVTATITRDDGSTLVAAQAAEGAGRDARSYALTPTDTATLDLLTARWTSAELGTLETQIEIVGGFLCGIGQIDAILDQRGSSSSPNSANVPLAVKVAARTVATDALESACNLAFTPRYARGKFDGTSGDLYLPTPNVRAVRSLSQNGEAIDLADAEALPEGTLYRGSGWRGGRRAYEVVWEHGLAFPPADVSRACALLAVYGINDGPWDDRGYGVVDEGGFARLLTAGVGGAMFSVPEVQSVVQRYRQPVVA